MNIGCNRKVGLVSVFVAGRRNGFTLIEALVAVAVIGLLVGVTLPAVQSARESARRTACMNNLKQLALAMELYQQEVGCYPMGTPLANYPDVGIWPGHSLFVAALPYMDQVALYDSINFNRNIYVYANQTCHATRLEFLACPSDPSVNQTRTLEKSYLDIPDGKFAVAYASYAGCSGTWYHYTSDLRALPRLSGQDNGVFFANSSIRHADIRDGSSNTLMLGERAHGRLGELDRVQSHWWFDGCYGDTVFWTLSPPNPVVRFVGNVTSPVSPTAAAGSFHPGGAFFAFCDGSVRFLKNSISSWAIDPRTNMPVGVAGAPDTLFQVAPETQLGVYQMLSTRSGGEVLNFAD